MTDKVIKPKNLKEEYELEDKDYLLIEAIKDLTNVLRGLR
tara:strand:- start:974 stop:1093 length:120 start_codon:yes stop_codon:yes gene_type:complete